jgi:hypothetical protein
MDDTILPQYRVLLLLIGAGLVFALAAVSLVSRDPNPVHELPDDAPPAPEGSPSAISYAMLLLVAMASGVGVLILVPALVVLPFYGAWKVVALVLGAGAFVAAPLLYAWRTRPF